MRSSPLRQRGQQHDDSVDAADRQRVQRRRCRLSDRPAAQRPALTMQRARQLLQPSMMAVCHQFVRRMRAAVLEGAKPAVLRANDHNRRATHFQGKNVTKRRQLGLVRDYLRGLQNDRLTIAGSKAGRSPGPCCSGRRLTVGRELAREDRPQVRVTAFAGCLAIDVRLRLERESLPEHLEKSDEADRDGIDVKVLFTALQNEALHQFTHERHEAVVFLATNLVIFLARGCLAPEGVPDRNLARTRKLRVKIQIHEPAHRLHRGVTHRHDRDEHLLVKFGGQVLQRSHQHGGLGFEVETDDAGRKIRNSHYLLDGSARRAVNVQRGDAGVDQPLPLTILRASAGTRFVGGWRGVGAVHRRPPTRMRSGWEQVRMGWEGEVRMITGTKHSRICANPRARAHPKGRA